MIRLIACLRRKKSISYREFRKYWEGSSCAGLIDETATAPKPVRNARNLCLQAGAKIRIMESRGSDEPCDGILEWRWEIATQPAPLLDIPQTQSLIPESQAYQGQFVDFDRSPVSFCRGLTSVS